MPALLIAVALAAGPDDFERVATEALADYQAACQREGGELWGVTLCGPLMIVEPQTRRAVANTADSGGAFATRGAVYAGTLPDEHGLANTAFDWEGRRWSMVLFPLPEDRATRVQLLVHESWHRIQPQLGFAADMVENGHLASESGRLWLRLEWRALRRALLASGGERRGAVADALAFRAHRHLLHPGARDQETALELNEGLAQYTGARVGHGEAVAAAAAAALERADGGDAFARSFAYATGPAWGLLLDEIDPGWRSEIGAEVGFADLAAAALGPPCAPPTAAGREPATDGGEPAACAEETRARAARYGYAELAAQEHSSAKRRQAETDRLLAALVESPTLVLPLRQMQMQFDPGGVVPLPPHGSVYRKIKIQDLWGEVEVTGGALLAADFGSLSLGGSATLAGSALTGDGWSLRLAEGWTAEETGDGVWRLVPPPVRSASPPSPPDG